ncbi:3-deoxy-manno-octulosonate cytidylyltransferase [Hyphococcus flavus]|uniref:3-deoxy-manno-octulosonate cytidylyltransferase n=1 Tax=Hyphococcus flavus TaxID=1866326 RepID=A0AAF0CDQ3_9PROT|nr:3-deoxy-manno-octulosonate cytidylyltransferase [Hyphococcus flavus]WDI30071.1 3-deoxy-manno-octulosonate cytidylyltransferase [Hyphococcus flavus]
MKAAVVIPARYESTRLPGKPLLNDTGKPLIEHVYEKASMSKLASNVIVATDDQRIFDAVVKFGGLAVMTEAAHETGTSRVAEAARELDADIIVNLQGDEPEIDPENLDLLIEMQNTHRPFASTLACKFPDNASQGPGSPDDPAAVKAILGDAIAENIFQARYFTRHICPWPRQGSGQIASPSNYYLHVGLYAFSKASLMTFASAPSAPLERAERLEQLRILEMGERMTVGIIDSAAPGIDTPEDYRLFVARERKGAARQ